MQHMPSTGFTLRTGVYARVTSLLECKIACVKSCDMIPGHQCAVYLDSHRARTAYTTELPSAHLMNYAPLFSPSPGSAAHFVDPENVRSV